MKAEAQKLSKKAAADHEDGVVTDPFAVDIFSSSTESSNGSEVAAVAKLQADDDQFQVSTSWHLDLPKLSTVQAEASAAMAALTPEFYGYATSAVTTVLSRYTSTSVDQISIAPIEFHESDFSMSQQPAREAPRLFATVVAEPNGSPFTIELEAGFVGMLIDRMLGGEGTAPDNLHSLTTAERAVAEFLFLSSTHELNTLIGEPLLRLQTVGEETPWRSQSKLSSEFSGRSIPFWRRGLVSTLRIRAGTIEGVARLHLSGQSLFALDESWKQLRNSAQLEEYLSRQDDLNRYSSVAPELNLSIIVGTTQLPLHELLQVERGDVMVVDRPAIVWSETRVRGSARIRVGDGEEPLIIGDLIDSGRSVPSEDSAAGHARKRTKSRQTQSLKLRVGSMSFGVASKFSERLKMQEETETVESSETEPTAIGNVMLTVHVELAARRVLLDELVRLRPSQILDLGCQATDPVDLIVDGRRVARGELVDIEGRLGVRITQVTP